VPDKEVKIGDKGPVVRMAPLQLPPQRRLQTLAVLLFWCVKRLWSFLMLAALSRRSGLKRGVFIFHFVFACSCQ
jgi:hypothetical protein